MSVWSSRGFDMQNKASIQAAVEALVDQRPFDIVFLQAGGMVIGAISTCPLPTANVLKRASIKTS